VPLVSWIASRFHSRRFRKLNFAMGQQIKSSGGAVAGLSSQATRLGPRRKSPSNGRRRVAVGLIIEIVSRQSMLADIKGMAMWWFDKGKPREIWDEDIQWPNWRY